MLGHISCLLKITPLALKVPPRAGFVLSPHRICGVAARSGLKSYIYCSLTPHSSLTYKNIENKTRLKMTQKCGATWKPYASFLPSDNCGRRSLRRRLRSKQGEREQVGLIYERDEKANVPPKNDVGTRKGRDGSIRRKREPRGRYEIPPLLSRLRLLKSLRKRLLDDLALISYLRPHFSLLGISWQLSQEYARQWHFLEPVFSGSFAGCSLSLILLASLSLFILSSVTLEFN
jgi:hypothetical protein